MKNFLEKGSIGTIKEGFLKREKTENMNFHDWYSVLEFSGILEKDCSHGKVLEEAHVNNKENHNWENGHLELRSKMSGFPVGNRLIGCKEREILKKNPNKQHFHESLESSLNVPKTICECYTYSVEKNLGHCVM